TAVLDAVVALQGRAPASEVCVVGFRFGAAAAAIAAAELDPALVVLLAPPRDAGEAALELARDSARSTLGRSPTTLGFGHTMPVGFADAGTPRRMASSMRAVAGRLLVAEFADPPTDALPDGAERLVVPGAMSRFRIRWAAHLARVAEPVVRRR